MFIIHGNLLLLLLTFSAGLAGACGESSYGRNPRLHVCGFVSQNLQL